MTGLTGRLLVADLRSLARRRWILAVAGAGLLAALAATLVAAGEPESEQLDAYRRSAASLFLLGGLVAALPLGAGALRTEADRGTFALLLGSGARRGDLAWSRIGSRVVALAAILAVWMLGLQAGALALFGELDGALAVHGASMYVNLLLAAMAAAAAGTLVGPISAGIAGVVVFGAAQSVVNLRAAADQGVIGSGADLLQAAYWLLPRTVVSPMIADLQIRDAAGPAAPRFDINGIVVRLPDAGLDTWLWALGWCGLMALVAFSGVQRRQL